MATPEKVATVLARVAALAATLEASIAGGNLTVRVTNESGHKLPTGYPAGRRMWLHVRAFDGARPARRPGFGASTTSRPSSAKTPTWRGWARR